jgi:NDP-sugar pyrophosphorylase family protein
VQALTKGQYTASDLLALRKQGIMVMPLLSQDGTVLDIIDLRKRRSALPLDAVVIAGGRGTRLRPLTDDVPKPLLKLNGKPILEHILSRLGLFGIQHVWLSVGYESEQLMDYFGKGEPLGLALDYIHEDEPLGTIGPVGKIQGFSSKVVLVMNADILTNIDLEDMMLSFEKEQADMMVASSPYEVPVPYAILETEGNRITEFREKPTYTYYANAGIYLIKQSLLSHIPIHKPYQATDLMRELIDAGKKVCYYPILGYWLDIGTPQDYEKAQRDIEHIQF